MKPAIVIFLSFLFMNTTPFAQINRIKNMLDLKDNPNYYEKLEIIKAVPLTMKIEIRYDEKNTFDEEYTYVLWIQLKDPPARGVSKTYDINIDSSRIKCIYYSYGAWSHLFGKEKYYTSGTILLKQNQDSSFVCNLEIRSEDSASHREYFYLGSRTIPSQNQYFLHAKGTWRVPLSDYTKFTSNETSDCPGSSVSFQCDSNSLVLALFDGELVSTGRVDTSYYYAVLRFGDYYIVYDHLKQLCCDKGYIYSQGFPIGQAYDNRNQNVVVTITLIKDGVVLPIFEWFRELKPSIEKIIYTPLSLPSVKNSNN